MKRNGIAWLCLLCFINGLQAQKGTALMLKPSLNLGDAVVKSGDYTSQPGIRLGYGIGMEIAHRFNKRFMVTAGGNLNSRGYKNVRTMYMDVPVAANLFWGWGQEAFVTGIGVYGGMALGGSYKTTDGRTKMKFGESTADNRSRFDAGWLINMGFRDGDFGMIHLSLMFGTKNVIPNDRVTGNNSIRLNTLYASWSLPVQALRGGK